MTLVPMTGFQISPNPYMAEHDPNVYMSMGHTAERVADEFNISREDMDQFAYESHQKAAAATDAGKFSAEIVPFQIEDVTVGEDGKRHAVTIDFTVDEHLRRDTTLEGLAKLKPAFRQGGRVTPGNSSPLSDGAAGVIVMEASKAAALGLKPCAGTQAVGPVRRLQRGRCPPGDHGRRADQRGAQAAQAHWHEAGRH